MSEVATATTLSVKVKAALKRQGRSVVWLCFQMGITRPCFYSRLKDNTWTVGEIIKIKQLLEIGE